MVCRLLLKVEADSFIIFLSVLGPAHTKILLSYPGGYPQAEPTRAGATTHTNRGKAKLCHVFMVIFSRAVLLYNLIIADVFSLYFK